MKTKILTCIQCEKDFEFSINEQEKYNQRGFNAPLRCAQCRKKKAKKLDFAENRKIRDKKKHYRLKSEGHFDF